MGRGVINDGKEKLVTEGAALKVWEGYFKELLNRGGNIGEPEFPGYVEGKVELMKIVEEMHGQH